MKNTPKYKTLDDNSHHALTNDMEIKLMLIGLGMMGAMPVPPCKTQTKQAKCGYALYQDVTDKFFIVIIRLCAACETKEEDAYGALLLSRKLVSPVEAFEIRDGWLKTLSEGKELEFQYLDIPQPSRN